VAFLLFFISSTCTAAPRLEDIRLPPGFRISVYADGLEQARSLALGERGTLFVGTNAGAVYAVPPGGGRAVAVARNLQAPHGVAFRGGALYVGEINRILRYDNIETSIGAPEARSWSRTCRATATTAKTGWAVVAPTSSARRRVRAEGRKYAARSAAGRAGGGGGSRARREQRRR
jgi:hypothetical protein